MNALRRTKMHSVRRLGLWGGAHRRFCIPRFPIRSVLGFTLIELLVVIAIISLLISILLPSLQRAKRLTRSMICLNQIRNMGMGFLYYQEDYKGVLPGPDDYATRYGGTVVAWGPTWSEYLCKRYLDDYPSRRLIVCPDRPDYWTNQPAGLYPDYGMNPYVAAWVKNDNPSHPISLYGWDHPNEIGQPAEIVLVTDSCWDPGNTALCYMNPQCGYYYLPSVGRVHLRHAGSAANALYTDGHVETVNATYEDTGDPNHPFNNRHFRRVN